MNVILGAGLAGISTSYHLGHDQCIVLEKKPHSFGHIHTIIKDGFIWDEGPHVSFTKSEYVRNLFASSVGDDYEEYPVRTVNYYKGSWIDHPAQSNLYQVSEPLRAKCLEAFLSTQEAAQERKPAHYRDWLNQAFGQVFTEAFPAAYTRKYWTVEPEFLTTEWVGERVFKPKIEDVVSGSLGPLERQTHYITHVRYPSNGGYESFARKMSLGMKVRHQTEVVKIDLSQQLLHLADGSKVHYSRLISTMPLPEMIGLCKDVPKNVMDAADALSCSQLVLVNVTAPHPTQIEGNWFYIYDEDKYSTRINCTECLAPNNAPKGHTGIQVEVYFSKFKKRTTSLEEIGKSVVRELCEMGFLSPNLLKNGMRDIHWFTHKVSWANVIFDHERCCALDTIWKWLEAFGLVRESDDTHPLTAWCDQDLRPGRLVMAGRFAQWKYYWTDDCVLRGKVIGKK